MSSGSGRTLGIVGMGVAAALTGGAALAAFAPSLVGTGIGSMLVGLAYTGGSFLGQMIFPDKNTRDMPTAPDYPMQTCDKGSAVKVTYGTVRVAGNLVWMGPLETYDGIGGKGGGGEDGQTMYQRSFLISICEGPREVKRIWKGKTEVPLSTGTPILSPEEQEEEDTGSNPFRPDITARTYAGPPEIDSLQQINPTEISVFQGDGKNDGLAELIGEDWSKYKWDCCVLFKHYDLGTTDTIPMFTFEVTEGVPLGLILGAGSAYRLNTSYEIVQSNATGLTFTLDVDPVSGRYVVAQHPSDTKEPFLIFDRTGTDQKIHFDTGPYNFSVHDVWIGVKFSHNGRYIYAVERRILYGGCLWKWDSVTGELIGRIGLTNGYGPLAIDSQDHLYMSGYGAGIIYQYDEDGAYMGSFTGLTVSGDLFFEEIPMPQDYIDTYGVSGYWLSVGYDYSKDPHSPHASIRIAHNGTVTTRTTFLDGTGYACIRSEGYNYVLTNHCTLYKLDNNLDVHASVSAPGAFYVFAAPGGLIGVTMTVGPVRPRVQIYDPANLTLVATYDPLNEDFDEVLWNSIYYPEAKYWYSAVPGGDANPADIIWDLATNTRYGAGMPTTYLNATSFADIRQYCRDNDLLISVSFDTSKPLLDCIQYICSHFGGFVYWMGGQLYLGAWRNEEPEFHITRDHLVVDGNNPPVQVRKRKYSETINHVELGWQNREDIYGPASTPFRDDVDIRLSGKRRKKQIELSGIKRPELANKMGWRYLIDSMYRFGIYSFKLGPNSCLLHVGQVGLLTDGFKITNQRIRITSISESKDGVNLDVEAVDDVSDLYPDLASRTPATTLRVPETPITAADLAAPTITAVEDTEDNEVILSLSPGNAYTSGWMVYTSWDGNTYTFNQQVKAGGVTTANSVGTLLTALPAAAPGLALDATVTVDIGTVTDLRTDLTEDDFLNGRYPIQIGDEILAYRTATEIAAGQWQLTGLIRGLNGTEPEAHAIGETFKTLDSDGTIEFSASDIGKTLYIKAVTYYRNVAQTLDNGTVTTILLTGPAVRPLSAGFARITPGEADGWQTQYSGDAITLYWNLPGKTAGFNIGAQDGGGIWEWGDSESLLVPQNGVHWGSYVQDPSLQGVDLVFLDANGTIIGSKNLGVVSTTTISKADDLGNNNPVTVEVYPRSSSRALRPATVTIDDGS